jgi:hypothetical protein
MVTAMMEAAKMPDRLHKPLAMPIVLRGSPARTIDTLLGAIEFLASSSDKGSSEVEITIDQLIAASQSEDPVALRDVTERLVRLLHQRGQL